MPQFEFTVKTPTRASYVGQVEIEADSLELAVAKLKELDKEDVEELVSLGEGWSLETERETITLDIFHGNTLIETKKDGSGANEHSTNYTLVSDKSIEPFVLREDCYPPKKAWTFINEKNEFIDFDSMGESLMSTKRPRWFLTGTNGDSAMIKQYYLHYAKGWKDTFNEHHKQNLLKCQVVVADSDSYKVLGY